MRKDVRAQSLYVLKYEVKMKTLFVKLFLVSTKQCSRRVNLEDKRLFIFYATMKSGGCCGSCLDRGLLG